MGTADKTAAGPWACQVHTPMHADICTYIHVHIHTVGGHKAAGDVHTKGQTPPPLTLHGGGVINISGAFSSEGAEAGGGRGIHDA